MEGRFRSGLVQSETWLLACYRYIELNPVRAAMVGHPRQYRWSSYRFNAQGKAGSLITPHDEYRRLGRGDRARQEAYRELVRDRLDEVLPSEIRLATNGGFVLGNAGFAKEIARILRRRVVRGKPGRPRRAEQDATTGPKPGRAAGRK